MDNNTFFSAKNTDLIYTICRDEVQKKTQYNIDSNKKYYKVFGNIMQIVHKHSPNQNDLTILNNKTIGKTIPYLIGEIRKKNLKDGPLIPSNNIVNAPTIMRESIASMNNIHNINGLPISFRASNERDSDSDSLKNNLDRIINERRDVHEMPEPINLTINDTDTYEDPGILMKKKMNEREIIGNIQNQHKPNLQQNNITRNNTPPKIQRTLLETKKEPTNPEISLDSYDLSNGALNDLYGDLDLSSGDLDLSRGDLDLSRDNTNNTNNTDISGLNTYNPDNDDIDPMKLFEMQNQQRNIENDNYKKIQQDAMDFETKQQVDNLIVDKMKDKLDNKNYMVEQKFQNSLNMDISDINISDRNISDNMNQINVDTMRGQLDDRLEKSLNNIIPPTANDLRISQDNDLSQESIAYEKLKSESSNRKYINRENLLVINSGDRDWFNESEDRYSFQIRFEPSIDSYEMVPKIDSNGLTVRHKLKNGKYTGDIVYEKKFFKGDQGLGVDVIYKNIVSFELVRVLMAIENFIIPFDNRFFIDYKSLPYIALKIDELQPLYSGTNSRVNKTFAKLLFDKDHVNEVVVSPKQAAAAYSTKYSRQLKRGFSSMAPMSNEKKTFYPSPLASLDRLTIGMITPYGANIKNHVDVLTVDNVKFVALNDGNNGLSLELDNSTGFPNDDSADSATYYLEITTTTAFSNRVFKIGDNIKFSGFDSIIVNDNTNTFINFMNREEGHYIINHELEETGPEKNEGYITKLYIPPPGEISYGTVSAVKTGNYSILDDDGNSIDLKSGICKVINQSIQTHFVFKIITREDDTTQFIKPANI